MKRRFTVIIALVLTALILTGCASGSMNDAASDMPTTTDSYKNYDKGGSVNGSLESESVAEDYVTDDSVMDSQTSNSASGGSFSGVVSAPKQVSLAEKIIYSARASIETVDFESAVEVVYNLVDDFGGFIESSYVAGTDYSSEFYGSQTYRNANFVIRIPSADFKEFVEFGLDRMGTVTYLSSEAENITTQYYDTSARLTAYRTQEQTLLAMMEKAATVSEMIEIENALSEVRYNIESLTTTLKNWDNQVDYSTVVIELQEVKQLTKQVPIQRTYWEEISDGFVDTLDDIGRFFKNLFSWIVINLPAIVVIAIFIAAALLILRKIFARQLGERRELKALREKVRRGKKNENGKVKADETDNG